ncbi:MAG: hypothetical protein JWP97_1568 [Labilithrix sp.]|nr:hypothetical protein [Labilithrix sp.]
MPSPPTGPAASSVGVIPIMREELHVEKISSETGRVRVNTHVVTEMAHVEEVVRLEDVRVERVPVGTPVPGPIAPRVEGDVTIISVVEEVLVVEKRFVLKEEIRITKSVTNERVSADVPLRREVADIEQSDDSDVVTR